MQIQKLESQDRKTYIQPQLPDTRAPSEMSFAFPVITEAQASPTANNQTAILESSKTSIDDSSYNNFIR